MVLDVHDLSTEVLASRRGHVPAPVRWAEKLSISFADRIVTVHEEYRDRITQPGANPDDVTVVLDRAGRSPLSALAPVTPRVPPRLIYHGTFVERYGLEVAVRAFAAAKQRVPASGST